MKKKVWKRDKVCRICSEPGDIVSHIKPMRNYPWLAKDIDNVLLLCAWCDNQFGEKLLEVEHKWKKA